MTTTNSTIINSPFADYLHIDQSSNIQWEDHLSIKKLELDDYPLNLVPWSLLEHLQMLMLDNYSVIDMDAIDGLSAHYLGISYCDIINLGTKIKTSIVHLSISGPKNEKCCRILPCYSDLYPSLRHMELYNFSITPENLWSFTQLESLKIHNWKNTRGFKMKLEDMNFILGCDMMHLRKFISTKNRWGLSIITSHQKIQEVTSDFISNLLLSKVDTTIRKQYTPDSAMTMKLNAIMKKRKRTFRSRDDEIKAWLKSANIALISISDPKERECLTVIETFIVNMLDDKRYHPVYQNTNHDLFSILNIYLSKPLLVFRKFYQALDNDGKPFDRIRELIAKNVTHPLQIWYAIMMMFSNVSDELTDPETTRPCVMRNVLTCFKVKEWNIPGELINLLWYEME
jgi:hypothetical protein